MKIQDLRNIVVRRIAELVDVEQMTMLDESSDPFDRLYNTGYFACLDCERDWLKGFLRDIDKVENPDHFPDSTKMVCADRNRHESLYTKDNGKD